MKKNITCTNCGSQELTEIGGDLLQCDYCLCKMQNPKENAELLERANNMRRISKDFDAAAKMYEEIIRMTPDTGEAYWGRVLCRFGIEYVKDPYVSGYEKWLPTCHRTIENSILEDVDYQMAIQKSTSELREYYASQAKLIDDYQKQIKAIAVKEEPYDVFISFKATDHFGKPTEDSLIAQELYYYLTNNLGLKVFFSNITLKNKSGQEYEPIIFAALSSATVMVLVGTSAENINAAWVKNEWSRYIKMIKTGRKQGKSRFLVPVLKGMRPEEMPSDLAGYQAEDYTAFGAKENICANIDRTIGNLRVKQNESAKNVDMDAIVEAMTAKKARKFCESGFKDLATRQFDKAKENFDKAANEDPTLSLIYWGRLLIEEGASDDRTLGKKAVNIRNHMLFQRAMEDADEEERERYELVARQCDRAMEKVQHNQEYKAKVQELKEAFRKNHIRKQIVTPVDSASDAAMKNYFKEWEEQSKFKEFAKPEPGVFVILAIFLGVVKWLGGSLLGVIGLSDLGLFKFIGGVCWILIGLCVVMAISEFIKSMRESTKEEHEQNIKARERIDEKCSKAKEAVYRQSGRVLEELLDFYNQNYPGDIETPEPPYCIALESLHISPKDLEKMFGVKMDYYDWLKAIGVTPPDPGMSHIMIREVESLYMKDLKRDLTEQFSGYTLDMEKLEKQMQDQGYVRIDNINQTFAAKVVKKIDRYAKVDLIDRAHQFVLFD